MCEFDWDDMEFYETENPEADRVISELVESVKKGVRKTFLDEMTRLRKENEELRDVKERWEDIKAELGKAIREAKIAQEGAEARAKKMRLNDLLEEVRFEAYTVDNRLEYSRPKCEKCDGERKVEFISPGGRKMKEPCTCAERVWRSYVEKVRLYRFYVNESIFGTMYYTRNSSGDMYDEIDASRFSDYKPFEEINTGYLPLFIRKEKAEAYSSWCNDKEATNNG